MNVKAKILSYSLVGVIGAALFINVIPNKIEAVDTKQKTSIINKEKSPKELANNIIYSKETDLPIVSSDALMKNIFTDLKTMYSATEVVAEIKVLNQNVVQTGETNAYTTSNVEVIRIFKGDTTLKNLLIAESGGPVDMTAFYENNKDKPGDGIKRENPPIMETTLEGVPVMKEGNSYLVFLTYVPKNEGEGIPDDLKNGYYAVQGGYQGKIKLDKAIKKAVATVGPEIINEEHNFFQKMFAGKDITTLENEIEKLNVQ